MAVSSGFVGSSAKKETGKEFMSEARKELRLSPNGWMSEMVGKSTEVRFVNTVNHTQANIHTLMGSPTAANVYVFENTAQISASTQGGWALQTGTFPAGSTLRIINKGHIRGGGGNGGNGGNGDQVGNGAAGGTALIINFPSTIDNTGGTIWGGGGGGGGGNWSVSDRKRSCGGGGGAGIPAGAGGSGITGTSTGGSATAGGAGGRYNTNIGGGAGGAAGAAGAAAIPSSYAGSGGRGGYSVQRNGHAVTWTAVGDREGSVV